MTNPGGTSNDSIRSRLRSKAWLAMQQFSAFAAKVRTVVSEETAEFIQEIRHRPAAAIPRAAPTARADRYMVSPVPSVRLDETVADASRRLVGQAPAFESIEWLPITDIDRRLHGLVPWPQFLAAAPETLISELPIHAVASVARADSPAQAAAIALSGQAPLVPVVDEQSRLLGVIPAQAVFKILREAHTQDLDRLVGIPKRSEQALSAIEGDPVRRTVHRLPWLLVGTLGSMLATGLMVHFEDLLRVDLAVAFFIPGIVYLADAIGTQSEAIAVRGLSFSRASIGSLWRSEFTTGLYLGITLALLLFPFIGLLFSASLAWAVSLALIFASSVASSIGLLFPWILTELGRDPAYGSGPLATIIQDLLSLLIYLITVNLLIF